jgi:hypothetical protein
MPQVSTVTHASGDLPVYDEAKLFEDSRAHAAERALVTFHAVAFDVLLYRPSDASILDTWTL